MARIENLKAYDPFQDTTGDDDAGPGDQGLVHIRIQQRNGRKTLVLTHTLLFYPHCSKFIRES